VAAIIALAVMGEAATATVVGGVRGSMCVLLGFWKP
jgi:hypothetical protein